MFKKWLIVAVTLLVIGILGALLTAKPYFSLENENETQTKQFKSSEIQSLIVSNSFGTIKLIETSGDEIIVENNGPKTSKSVKIETEGDSLSITNDAKKSISLGINLRKSSENITVYLPKKQYERITISNDVGEITINQINAVYLNVKSDVADIDISDVSSTSLNVSSEVGDVSIKDYSGKLEIENETGSIEISTDKVTQSLIAHNEVGEIDLTINQKPMNIFISADSDIGSTRIFGQKTGSYMNGDGSITVDLSTELGDIRVND